MTEERAELKAAVERLKMFSDRDDLSMNPYMDNNNFPRLALLKADIRAALSQDAKPEPGGTVTEAMVERGAKAICGVYGGNAWGAWKRSARAALTAALQPPVAGE